MARVVLPGVLQVFFPRALVNAYVVRADVLTIVDTGTPGAAGKILAGLDRVGLRAVDVGRILLTHAHADHAGNAAELAAATGAAVHVSPGAAPFVSERREQPRPRPATPMGRGLVPYVKVALPWTLESVATEPSLVDGAQVGPFRVIDTPGHSAGHVSLLWEERGILFAGDAAANITAVGPHPAADDPALARATFRRLGEHRFGCACFGHGLALRERAAERFRG